MSIEQDSELKTLKRFINIVDETLNSPGWQETALLRSIENKIKELRDEALALEQQYKQETQVKKMGLGKGSLTSLQTVYVSVYQQDFNDIQKWGRTLKSITDYSVTRPIYSDEAHIKEMIRGRPDPNKEGYVAVLVKNEDVIKPFSGKPSVDKQGYELLNIKEGGIKTSGIQRFVLNAKTYEFVDGALQLIQSEHAPKEE